ncbi:ABC transporter substrate-binding protein [Paenibacillaceae bacterium WGS1546]|uniref:ABC transporter substrate-binding protein n=1 Tax=Cohnella sp. WGS1546 TaxID=3366810 RepID=UPI00372D5927
MKKKRVLIAGLIAAVAVLSACSSGGNGNASGNGGSANGNGAAQTPGTGTAKEAETYRAVMAIPSFQTEPRDMQLVEDEINKIMKEKINATVDIVPIAFGNWVQQTNLMLSSGEKLDLFVTANSMGYASQAVTGKIAPLDELLAGPGRGIADQLGEKYLNAAKIEGQVYGVPSLRDLAASYDYVMRKDLVDKYQIDLSSVRTLDDVEKVLQTIKENEPGITPIVPGGSGSGGMLIGYNKHDQLGDSYGVLMDPDVLTVTNYYESPEYEALLKKMHDWYKKGYILRDAATNQVVANQLVKAGKAFSYLGNSKPGFAVQESRAAGMEMVAVELAGPVATTGNVTSLMWSIAQSSENKEKAMEILNLFYTDKDIVNLINWGIEGKHYQKVEGDIIDFAPGVDATNSDYLPNWEWMTGNAYLSYIYKGGDPEVWNKTKAFNESAVASKALGFTFNVEPVKTEYTAITNVVNQFKVGLESGTLDPDKVLPEFNDKLKAAGIDKVIAEKQRQLDEWAQLNNIQ